MTVRNKSFPSQPNFPINNPYPLETAIKLVITPGKRRLPLFESNSNIDSSSNISPSHLNTQSESCDQFSPTKSHRPLNDSTKGSPLSKLAARKSAGLTGTNISSGMASNGDESSILPISSNKENIFESSSLLNIDTKNLNNEYAYSIDRPKSAFSMRHGRITISSSDSAPDLSMGATLDEFNINNNNNNNNTSVLSQHLVEESQHEMFGQNLQREEEDQQVQQQQQQHTPQHTPQQVQTTLKKHPSNGADSRFLIPKKENILPYEGEIPKPENMPPVSDPASKPGYSYALLIGMAILRAPRRRLTLSAIYSWISNTFVYYRSSNSGWQNSIRHNLSLNKAFCKQERPKDEPGKGHYWTIVPGFESHFLALEASCLEKEESSQKSHSSSNNKDANSSSLSKLINANNNNSNNNNNSQQGVHHRHKGSSKMNSNSNKSKLSQNAQNDILEFTNNNGNSDVNINNQEYHHLNTNLCGGRISPKMTYQPLTSMPTTSPGTSLKMHRSRVLQYLNCQSPVPSLHSPSLSASSMSTNASSMYIDDYHLSNQARQPSLQQQQQQQQIATPRQQRTPQQTPQGCVTMQQTISYHQQAHPQQQMQYFSAYAGYYTSFSPNSYHNSPNIDSSLFFVDPYSENDNVVPSPCKPHYWIQNRSASVSEGLNMTPSKNPVLPLNSATAATKISDDDIIARACFGSPDKREFHQLQKRKSMICGASHAVELYEPEGSGNLTDVFGVDVYNVIAREVKRRRFQQEHHGHNISF